MLTPVIAEIKRAGRSVQGATYVSYRRRHPASPNGRSALGATSASYTATAVARTPPRRRRTKR